MARKEQYIFRRKRRFPIHRLLLTVILLVLLIFVGLFLYFNLFGTASRVTLADDLTAEQGTDVMASSYIVSIKGGSIDEDQPIDTAKAGPCKVTLPLRFGQNVREYQFTVTVQDTQAPLIEAEDEINVIVRAPFDPSKVARISDGSGLSPDVETEGTVDTETAGSYGLTIKATDQAGNHAEKAVTVHVIDPVTREGDYAFVTANGFPAVREGGITYVDGIMIVNKTFSLPSTYAPGGLLDDAYVALIEMTNTAAEEGHSLYLASGFRSYATQVRLYRTYCANDGQEKADTYSARPGFSEHQSGYTLDLNTVDVSFADTPAGQWVNDHCAEYGYIIRYPKGKDSVTGYEFEPWHIRYVGKDLAEKLYNGGNWISLEEYFGLPSIYTQASWQ